MSRPYRARKLKNIVHKTKSSKMARMGQECISTQSVGLRIAWK